MGLTAHPVPNKQKSADLCAAFIAGTPKDAVGHVFYGVTDANHLVWRKVLKSGEPFYFVDNSYFDCVRGQQFRVTKNAIQVQGALVQKSDGARFTALGLTAAPVQRPGAHIVLIEQSPGFMRLIAKDPHWLVKQRSALARKGPVRVREWSPHKPAQQATLGADLKDAALLVTHTSAAAVTAAVAGVPFNVSRMHALFGMTWDQRQHFLNVLADNQFTLGEMKSGVAYSWLNR